MEVVSQIKQVGREIILEGDSSIGYQHSANLYVKLKREDSATDPFSGMMLSAFCRHWSSKDPVSCPLEVIEGETYILLPNKVFEQEGDVYLSLGAVDNEKIVITTNMLCMQVDESNHVLSSTTPPEEYWQREVYNAVMLWYAKDIDPVFKASEEKLNQMIRRGEEQIEAVDATVKEVTDKLSAGEFDGRTTFNGVGDPDVELGKDGDTYLNKSNEGEHPKWLYLKEGGAWVPLWNTQGIDGTDTLPVDAIVNWHGGAIPTGYVALPDPYPNVNLLINGDFQVWQRGTAFTGIGTDVNNTYTADRWLCGGDITPGVATHMIVSKTAGGALLESTDGEIMLRQHIERVVVDTDLMFRMMIDGHMVKQVCKFTEGATTTYEMGGMKIICQKVAEKEYMTLIIVIHATSATLKWIELKPGIDEVQHIAPFIGDEFLKCYRYYANSITITGYPYTYKSGTHYWCNLFGSYPTAMRIVPNVKFTHIYIPSVGIITGNSVSSGTVNVNALYGSWDVDMGAQLDPSKYFYYPITMFCDFDAEIR